ncbi:hypothetical protein DFH07DRAFT_61880 [Mycena maculata]|uniref:polynucleotide adenylyltransferase n=1 Tax=Mycena maculata TaxID=230809 RepID=A0AAD7N208_9AGAR|nr:hypothetical protein DFH07DRAFT_61880 [Mycena maculata]
MFMNRTAGSLFGGHPLSSIFGRHLAPPGSAAEALILSQPVQYSAAVGLLDKDTRLEVFGPFEAFDSEAHGSDPANISTPLAPVTGHEPDPRLHRVLRGHRGFHTSSVSRAKKKILPPKPKWPKEPNPKTDSPGGFGLKAPIGPPKPIRPAEPTTEAREGFGLKAPSALPQPSRPAESVTEPRERFGPKAPSIREPTFWRPGAELSNPIRPAEPATEPLEGFGLKAPSVREPTFWRPGAEPLKLPTRDGARSLSPVPPVRATRAGVAYKDRLSKPRQFHTSAVRSAPPARVVKPAPTTPDGAVDASVLAARERTRCAVERAIRKKYGREYSVELFGSARYGISKPSSDLDMVILDPTAPYGLAAKPGRLPPVYNIPKLAATLRKAGFKIVDVVSSAAVPIVIFQDPATGLSCDINVNDRLGLLNSDLIRRYCELNHVLVDMVLYIKKWAKPLGLNHPSSRNRGPVTFSSYALVMMAIGFLQHRGLLPNLQEGLPPLRDGQIEGTFWLRHPSVLRCDVRYNEARDWTPPEQVPVHQLIHDWFKFWALEFDYKEEMISIRHGGRVLRSSLAKPMEFRGILWTIDPFIRTKNVTQNLSRESITRFKLDCYRYSMMPDFERGALPAPSGKRPEVEKPNVIRWLPVQDDELPLPWRAAPVRFNDIPVDTDAEVSEQKDPVDSVEVLADAPEALKAAEPFWSAPLLDPHMHFASVMGRTGKWDAISSLDANKARESSSTGEFLDASSAEESSPSSTEDSEESFQYDPSIRFDDYGRPIGLEELGPPPPPPETPGEPEVDAVGWGFKSTS